MCVLCKGCFLHVFYFYSARLICTLPFFVRYRDKDNSKEVTAVVSQFLFSLTLVGIVSALSLLYKASYTASHIFPDQNIRIIYVSMEIIVVYLCKNNYSYIGVLQFMDYKNIRLWLYIYENFRLYIHLFFDTY